MSKNEMCKIINSIGYVFEKRKLIISIPVGGAIVDKSSIKKQFEFMSFDPKVSLPCDAVSVGEANAVFISQMLREKPSDSIVIMDDVLDYETDTTLEDTLELAKKVCNAERIYLDKGYKIIDVYEYNETLDKYIIEKDFEHCTILEKPIDKFNLKKLLLDVQNFMENKNCVSILRVRKSKVVNHVFVTEDEQNLPLDVMLNQLMDRNASIVIPFMVWDGCYQSDAISLDGSIDLDIFSCDDYSEDHEDYETPKVVGEIELVDETIVGYLVSKEDININIKIVKYTGIQQENSLVFDIVEDAGELGEKMKAYIENYNK